MAFLTKVYFLKEKNMNKIVMIAIAAMGLGGSLLSWADSVPVSTIPVVGYALSCGSQNITLGMSSDKVLSACGKPTKTSRRNRNGSQYMKIKYSLNGNIETNLELKFSDMQNKDDLQLYKIEYESVQNSANPYKR
ncbi:MAG: hypothetical protein ACJA0H_000974 [Francisellaceae bacterium]